MARDRTSLEYGALVCKAVRLMAEGYTIERTARELGVRHITLINWTANEDFKTLREGLMQYGHAAQLRKALGDLTDEAVEALQRTLRTGSGIAVAQAARDVLKWAAESAEIERQISDKQRGQEIVVHYGTPDGKPYSNIPWADRNPPGERSRRMRT